MRRDREGAIRTKRELENVHVGRTDVERSLNFYFDTTLQVL